MDTCLFWLSCPSETIPTLLRNGGFPAVLINKDVAGISDSGPPKVNFWAQRATRKNNACYLAALELQPLPTVSTEELSGCEHTGYWPQIAEMHMKGMISVSPDSGHLPIHRKALNSLTGDICSSLINSNLLTFRLPFPLMQNFYKSDSSPCVSLEQFSQGYLRCCLSGLKS